MAKDTRDKTPENEEKELGDLDVFDIDNESEDQNSNEKKSHLRKRILIALGCVVVVLVLAYAGVSVYYMDRFLMQTTLNGMDVSGMTAAEVEEKESEDAANYVLTIICRDGSTYTVDGAEFSLEMQWNDGITNLAKEQSGFKWIVSLFSTTELELEGTLVYDEQQLAECLAALDFMQAENQQAAVDATISEYSETDGYTLVASIDGTEIDEELLTSVVEEAVMALNGTVNLEESGCYLEAEILDDNEELLAAIDELNTYAGTEITYTIGDDTFTLGGDTISGWLSVSDDFAVALNEDEVTDYVSSLASTYNTCYSNKTLATSYGETVTITNVHYGWKVDQETEAAQIIEEILAGTSISRDLNYSMTANSHTGNDYGNSYVEINLTAQHLYLYDNGTLVMETDFVSGLASDPDRATPTGAFTVTYKQKDATLNGANYSSHVDYWMPFYGNYGMHDATWRSSFGGTIYKTNGSHGCINMPHSAAETMYNTIDKGWPVLIYTLEGTESGTAQAKKDAAEVVDAIDEISDTVTLEDADAITNARTMYDALSSSAKEYVTNYDTLTAAESALETLKAAETNEESDDSDSADVETADAESSDSDTAE